MSTETKARTCAACGTEMADNRRKFCSDECKKAGAAGPEQEEEGQERHPTPDEQADQLLALAKHRFLISEVAPVLAAILGITTSGAQAKIYRGIERGEVKAIHYLGSMRLPRPEVERIVRGESTHV